MDDGVKKALLAECERLCFRCRAGDPVRRAGLWGWVHGHPTQPANEHRRCLAGHVRDQIEEAA